MRVHRDWLLTPERTAIHLPTATAVVADLHLGYEDARRRNGEAVPALPLGQRLAPLREVFARHNIQNLLIAGDLVEQTCTRALAEELLAWVAANGVRLTALVPGNHDRGVESTGLLPVCRAGVLLDDWRVVHGDGDLPPGRSVCGHFHPWLRRGRISAPCYLVGERLLVLPAFSLDAAGVNVLRQECWQDSRCCAIAGDEVLDLGEVRLLRTRG
jgi:uncharacterized protein